MKKFLPIAIILLLIFGCTNTELREPTTVVELTTPEKDSTDQELYNPKQEVPEGLFGYYISTAYLEKLKKTSSTRDAQDASVLSMVEIRKGESNAVLTSIWNFHEGGGEGKVVMQNIAEGEVISTYDNKKMFSLQILPNEEIMLKEPQHEFRLVKIDYQGQNTEAATATLINKALFEGEYWNEDNTVKLTREGKVIGIDSLLTYHIETDYMDVGMNLNVIYLTVKGRKHLGRFGDDYGYEFNKDTLEIFKFVCSQYLPEAPDVCEEQGKGEVLYRLVRK